jgi:hypothetical protein
MQHAATALLRQMLAVLDLAADTGTPSDKRAADRLQRRCSTWSVVHLSYAAQRDL